MVEILPEKLLIKRNVDDDCVNFYYRPVVGMFYRKRLSMVYNLMKSEKYGRILEIGYGSGVFMPALQKHGKELFGIDIHDYHSEVKQILAKAGIKAELQYGDIGKIPHSDRSFDCIVSISVLEHVRDLDTVIDEIKRVLRPGGTLVAGFPTRNAVSSFLFEMLKFNHEENHPSDQNRIIGAIQKKMKVRNITRFPSFVPGGLSLYNAVKAINEQP